MCMRPEIDTATPLDPVDRELAQLMAGVLGLSASMPDVPDTRRSLDALNSRMGRAAGEPGRSAFSRASLPRWLASAAVLCVVAFALVELPPPSSTGPTARSSAKSYVTHPGQRAVVTIADGVSATLAPGTTLELSGRNADIVGEALFVVSHNSGTPFTVRSGKTITRVLGTTFAVRKYPDEPATRVSVAEGRVAVADRVLSNGDVATALANDSVRIVHDADAMLATLAFAQGKLIIDSQSLGEAAPQISRWFALDIEVSREVSTRPFTLTIQHETVPQVLQMIAELTGTSYSRNGNRITFTSEQP